MNKFKDILKDKKFRKGSLSAAITLGFIALIVLINVCVNYLSKNHDLTLDLTHDQVFNLTEESKEYIKNIDKDVQIIVLDPEDKFIATGDYFVQANYVIKQYAINSDKISVEYINLEDNPTFASNFPNEDVEDGSIIVRCGDNYQILDAYDLFNIESSYYYGTQITSSKAEQTMTSAIMSVLSDEKTKVTFIEGFDEENYTSFSSLLKKNNYEVETASLLNEDIDSESSIAIIFAPNRDYDDEAINKVRDFLSLPSKSLIYVSNVAEIDAPNLKSFLNEYGVNMGSGIVFETDPNLLITTQSPFYAIDSYSDYEYTNGLKNTSIPVVIPFSKPIEVLDETIVKVLIESSDTSGVVPANAASNWQPSDSDMVGAVPLVTLSTKNSDESNSSSVCVVGSMVTFDNAFLSKTSINNSQYFLNLFNILSQREYKGITIESKAIGGDELSINASQALALGLIFTLAIPLAIFVAGLVIFIKRRHK